MLIIARNQEFLVHEMNLFSCPLPSNPTSFDAPLGPSRLNYTFRDKSHIYDSLHLELRLNKYVHPPRTILGA